MEKNPWKIIKSDYCKGFGPYVKINNKWTICCLESDSQNLTKHWKVPGLWLALGFIKQILEFYCKMTIKDKSLLE